jgi:hypothetical protein
VPTFGAGSVSGLYWLAEPALPAGYGIAYLPAAGVTPPAASLTLAESWTAYPGLYLSTATRPEPAGEPAFVEQAGYLWAWLGRTARFAWVADTRGPASGWGALPLYVLQAPGAATGTVEAPARLVLGAYVVGISTGVAVTLAADGFTLTGGPTPPFTLARGGQVWAMTGPVQGGSPATALPFAGAAAGCVLLDLDLPQGTGDDYARLDVGMRMAVGSARADHAAAGLLRSLSYPVFTGVPGAGVSFAGTFDPALPLDAARTRLAYATTPAHGSAYRGTLGYPVTLTPAAGGSPLPAGLAFHRRPPSMQDAPGDDPLYLGPIGPFALGVDGGAPRLACGLSGYESFALSSPTGAVATFTPGQPAYADGLVAPDRVQGALAGVEETGPVTLDARATCPYGFLAPAGGATVTYAAQPRGGALHALRSSGDASLLPYLVFLDVPAGAAGTGPATPYPLLPYAGVAAGDEAPLYERLEAQVLAPARRDALASLGSAAAGSAPAVTGVTPRGLLAGFAAGLGTWESIQLASYTDGATPGVPPPVELLTLGAPLRAAFLSNQLCLVAADAGLLLRNTDLNYWVTPAALADLAALPPGERPSDAVLAALATARTPEAGRAAFVAMLDATLPAGWTEWEEVILQYCAYFELVVAGWRFRLSPTVWDVGRDPDHPVLMIVKFASGPLRALASDPGSWTWPEVAKIDGSVETTAAVLRAMIADADAQVAAGTTGSPSPLESFVYRVLDDPAWNGVLVLNARVPLDDLPPELLGLAVGIDATRFRAHHVGVSVSPVTVDTAARTLSQGASPVFGLIDYQDPEDIEHTYEDFDFKVLLLRVLLQSSAVANFASRVELFVNRLLGEAVTLSPSGHYNNLILDGTYQRAQDGGQYVFLGSLAGRFLADSQVVESIEVQRAQFNTLAVGATISSRFTLWGRLRFRALEGLDLFSFGPQQPLPGSPVVDGWLAFGGLGVEMTFQAADPAGTRTFTVDVGSVAFDGASSPARATSFFRRFPLQLAGLAYGPRGTLPRDRGYLAVRTPLFQPALNEGWYALVFTVDLGTLGALAASAGLTVTLAAAWGPSPQTAAVNVGLQLPGVQSLGQLLPIEGVLGLGFQGIELDASAAPQGGPSYVLRLRRFYLRILGWQFPPGQAVMYLFGDPDVTRLPDGGRRGALGWYAAYRRKE